MKIIIFLFILFFSCFAFCQEHGGYGWDEQVDIETKYHCYEPSDPEFGNARIETNPVFQENIINKNLIVTVVEWQGYQGNDPNTSYSLDELIVLAKAKYKNNNLLSVTKEPHDCHGTMLVCTRYAWLVFALSYEKDVK